MIMPGPDGRRTVSSGLPFPDLVFALSSGSQSRFRVRSRPQGDPKNCRIVSGPVEINLEIGRKCYIETFVFSLDSDRQTGRINASNAQPWDFAGPAHPGRAAAGYHQGLPAETSFREREAMSYATAVCCISVIRRITSTGRAEHSHGCIVADASLWLPPDEGLR